MHPPNSNTILVIDPTHQIDEERCFWNELAFHANRMGFNYIQVIAAYHAPQLTYTIYVPKPGEPSWMEERLKIDSTHLPQWADDASLDMICEWDCIATGRLKTHSVRQRMKALAAWVDEAMTALRPSAVLLASDLLPAGALFLKACRHYGIKCFFQERSPCGGMWLEPNGYFAHSSLWHEWPSHKQTADGYRQAGLHEIAMLAANPAGFRKFEDGQSLHLSGHNADKPVFLMLMDNVTFSGWHPKGLPLQENNYPLYDTPSKAVSHVASLARKIGGTLILKRHPACCIYTAARPTDLPPDVIYYDGPLDAPLRLADVVVTFISKTAFAALAMGKPVVTLAQNPVAASGSTYHPRSIEEVEQALNSAAGRIGLDLKLDSFIPFVGWAAREFYYSFASNPPVFPDLAEPCGPCQATRGPQDLLKQILGNIIPGIRISGNDISNRIAHLVYLTGRDHTSQGDSQTQHNHDRLSLIGQCAQRVAIYGAGKYAQKILSSADTKSSRLPGGAQFQVFDDNPGMSACKVFPVSDSKELLKYVTPPGSVVIMATDTWQAQMRARLHKLGVDNSKIIELA